MSEQLFVGDKSINVSFSQMISSSFIRSDICRTLHETDNKDCFEIFENENRDNVDKYSIVRLCGCPYQKTRRPRIFTNRKVISIKFVLKNMSNGNNEILRLIAICVKCSKDEKNIGLEEVFFFKEIENINSRNKHYPYAVFRRNKSWGKLYDPLLSHNCFFCEGSFCKIK